MGWRSQRSREVPGGFRGSQVPAEPHEYSGREGKHVRHYGDCDGYLSYERHLRSQAVRAFRTLYGYLGFSGWQVAVRGQPYQLAEKIDPLDSWSFFPAKPPVFD